MSCVIDYFAMLVLLCCFCIAVGHYRQWIDDKITTLDGCCVAQTAIYL